MFDAALLCAIREQFHHVDRCPYQGPRIFFENAGGSLTLKSVVAINAELSAIPDNQGRDNPASRALVRLIEQGRQDMMSFLGASQGVVFVGESGTECLFRMIRAAILDAPGGGTVVGSTLEHPATVSACRRWSQIAGKRYIEIPHNHKTATVTADDYRQYVTSDTCVATIIQTSPVTGMSVDVKEVVSAIRAVSPSCFIVIDGIQHAPHGNLDVDGYDIDGYAVSGYKVYSRHNYGVGWLSSRLAVGLHDKLDGTAADFWELGTRDTAAYATFSAVVDYLDWLGGRFVDSADRRQRLVAAGKAIAAHERHLVKVMIHGTGQQKGLIDMPRVRVIGGYHNRYREGVVSLVVDQVDSQAVVRQLSERGIRVHVRKNDYFSGAILTPLGLESCVRVSLCHYNTVQEVLCFNRSMEAICSALH